MTIFQMIMVAAVLGLFGDSAFTAQLGAMKMRQEIDAMRTIGLDPFQLLVVPRVLALVIALVIGHLMGGPTEDDRTALAIACATRHIGIALVVFSYHLTAPVRQISTLITRSTLAVLLSGASPSVTSKVSRGKRARSRPWAMLTATKR